MADSWKEQIPLSSILTSPYDLPTSMVTTLFPRIDPRTSMTYRLIPRNEPRGKTARDIARLRSTDSRPCENIVSTAATALRGRYYPGGRLVSSPPDVIQARGVIFNWASIAPLPRVECGARNEENMLRGQQKRERFVCRPVRMRGIYFHVQEIWREDFFIWNKMV